MNRLAPSIPHPCRWAGPLFTLPLALGCGDASGKGADLGMATEIDGQCQFEPGSYVASYALLDATPGCGGEEVLLPDEYLTVTSAGELAGNTELADGCTQGEPVVDGCFVGVSRNCVQPIPGGTVATASGVVESRIDIRGHYQIDYAAGTGIVTITAGRYSAGALTDACVANFEATIRGRR